MYLLLYIYIYVCIYAYICPEPTKDRRLKVEPKV